LQDSTKPYKVIAKPTPGFIYLYIEDDLPHFCWRPRSAPLSNPGEDALDLIMFPSDGSFKPYTTDPRGSSGLKSPTDGRIYVLRFDSSSTRHLFWLQSKPTHANGASWFSERDEKIGEIVNQILQGEDVDVQEELANVGLRGDEDDDGDTNMEDAGEGDGLHRTGSGGAGVDATGGDVNEEGEDSRRGGEDGARA